MHARLIQCNQWSLRAFNEIICLLCGCVNQSIVYDSVTICTILQAGERTMVGLLRFFEDIVKMNDYHTHINLISHYYFRILS